MWHKGPVLGYCLHNAKVPHVLELSEPTEAMWVTLSSLEEVTATGCSEPATRGDTWREFTCHHAAFGKRSGSTLKCIDFFKK